MLNTDDSGFEQSTLDELISLREASEISGLSAGHLRLLAAQGEIWALEVGRTTGSQPSEPLRNT